MGSTDDRLFTPAFIALTASELAYFTVAGLIIGVTPFFVLGPLGSDEAGIGLAAAAFGATTLLLRPFAGRLADRRGRRPLLISGSALCAAVVLAHLLPLGLAALVGLRLLLGVAEALFFVAAYAAVADLAPRGRAGEALSYNSLALYLGLALGPLIGQQLLKAGGFPAAWVGGFVLAAVAVVLAMRVPETTAPVPSATDAPLLHRAALWPGLILFAGVSVMAGYLLLVGPHAERIGLEAWSLTFLVFGAVVVGLRVAFARLPDRVRPMRLAAGALAVIAAGLAIAAVAPGILGLLVGTVGLATGVAFMTPAVFAATFARVAPAERGAASGTASMFIDLGFGGGPLVLGFIASGLGFGAAMGVGALIALLASLGTLAAMRIARAGVRVPAVG
jgi:predicted MFS family arabinose efflux permease